MGTTPNRNLPYPELSDPADVPADMKELADAVDAVLTMTVVGGTTVLSGTAVMTTDASAYGHVDFPYPCSVATIVVSNGDASLAGDKVFAVVSPFSPTGFDFWVEGSPNTQVRVNWLAVVTPL
jgi:hypothetical protein